MVVDAHPIGIILKSNPIKGIRFDVSKEHWAGNAAYRRLPERVIGSFQETTLPRNSGPDGRNYVPERYSA